MVIKNELIGLPPNFKVEKKALVDIGIKSWNDLKFLNDEQINLLIKTGLSTQRNLKRARGIAQLICDLKLEPSDAALLMHAGFATVTALASATPQEVLIKTGRLERQLLNRHHHLMDLPKANKLI